MTTADNDTDLPLSKTRRKQAMAELQSLGEELAGLSADRLKKIDLPESLADALRQVQRMTRTDEARRRQMQYIGRLMRDIDPAPIREVLAAARGDSAVETARMHRLERLREAILADERALGEIASEFPGADLQHLRALRRAALKEQATGKPPRSYRALFRALRELAGENASETADTDSDAPDDDADEHSA
ncbi:ribosome biogenesis factor YjgA [Rhodocyclus tenuis]|uniref:Dual-action ribosomal maturation protein DarP n=1 Tax=Rhodocyclus tenuis TaxID=1066 RepID=A0A840G9M3_RHOTE|nr:ribosome biogenesis factor YjgA [Rhodocyclus tenuis]MBB4247378.1 ribosome-associated protein [Rhodocyclus tenuis]